MAGSSFLFALVVVYNFFMARHNAFHAHTCFISIALSLYISILCINPHFSFLNGIE